MGPSSDDAVVTAQIASIDPNMRASEDNDENKKSGDHQKIMLGGLPVFTLSVLLQKLQLVGMTIVNCDEPTQGSLTPLKYPFSDDRHFL